MLFLTLLSSHEMLMLQKGLEDVPLKPRPFGQALAKDADRDGNGYCTVTRLRISSHQFFAISTPELHPLVGMGTVKHVIRMCYLLGATHSLPLFRSLSYWISS